VVATSSSRRRRTVASRSAKPRWKSRRMPVNTELGRPGPKLCSDEGMSATASCTRCVLTQDGGNGMTEAPRLTAAWSQRLHATSAQSPAPVCGQPATAWPSSSEGAPQQGQQGEVEPSPVPALRAQVASAPVRARATHFITGCFTKCTKLPFTIQGRRKTWVEDRQSSSSPEG